MEKRTLWQIAAVVITLLIAVVLFRFVANRSYPMLCPTGSCASNWGQDDPLKSDQSKPFGDSKLFNDLDK